MEASNNTYSPREYILFLIFWPLFLAYFIFKGIYLGIQYLYCGIIHNTWNIEEVSKTRRAKSILKRKEAKEDLKTYMDKVLKETQDFLDNKEESA